MLNISGCSEDGIKTATGETPVKYIICKRGDVNCFIAARFKDMDSCMSHKEWADMICEKMSTPGKMVCTTDTHLPTSVAYCTF